MAKRGKLVAKLFAGLSAAALISVFANSAYAVIPGDPSVIDPGADITLTIHKYTTPAADSTTLGREAKADEIPATAKPVEGIKFTWKKVDPAQINLLTNQGWKDAAAVAEKFNAKHDVKDLKKGDQDLVFVKNGEGTTNATGEVAFTYTRDAAIEDPAKASPVGLYLITETDVSGAKVDGNPVSVSPALPFLVTLPMTDPGADPDADNARTSWNYNVHVYPKNAVVEIKKTVDDTATIGKNSGEKLDLVYTLDSDIPLRQGPKADKDKGTPLDKYVVMDKFDATKVEAVLDDVTVHYCKPTAEDPECETAQAAEYQKTVTDGLLKVNFTETGLAKLGEVRNGAESAVAGVSKQAFVRVIIPAKLIGDIEAGTATSDLDNTAYLVPDSEHGENLPPDPNNPNTPSEQPDGKTPPIPSTKVTTKFGKIKLHKVSEDGSDLEGATFGLYTCDINNTGQKVTVDADSAVEVTQDDNPVKAVTDNKGSATFPQVRVSDFANNSKLENSDAEGYQGYCIKELKAPKGYELIPEYIPVDMKAESVANGVYELPDNIVNVKHNAGFKIPMTGSNAIIVLLVVAGGLMLGGLLLAARRNRQQA